MKLNIIKLNQRITFLSADELINKLKNTVLENNASIISKLAGKTLTAKNAYTIIVREVKKAVTDKANTSRQLLLIPELIKQTAKTLSNEALTAINYLNEKQIQSSIKASNNKGGHPSL